MAQLVLSLQLALSKLTLAFIEAKLCCFLHHTRMRKNKKWHDSICAIRHAVSVGFYQPTEALGLFCHWERNHLEISSADASSCGTELFRCSILSLSETVTVTMVADHPFPPLATISLHLYYVVSYILHIYMFLAILTVSTVCQKLGSTCAWTKTVLYNFTGLLYIVFSECCKL